MKGRVSAVSLVAVMMLTMLGAPLAASGESPQEINYDTLEINTSSLPDTSRGVL